MHINRMRISYILHEVYLDRYLYFITQMGISVSPLSNNALFLKMSKSPFPDFFHRGLNAASALNLGSDGPKIKANAFKKAVFRSFSKLFGGRCPEDRLVDRVLRSPCPRTTP